MSQVIAPPVPSAPPAARRRDPVPWLLLLGTVAQVALRLWLARARTAPVADPDDTSYLAGARWLAGGPGADLTGHTFYQAGYPLLISPLHWFTDDPATVYTGVMAINALVGAALFPMGVAALRRLGLGRRAALPLAFAAALLPASTFFGMFALTDAILPTLVLGWLLLLDRFVRTGRAVDGTLASLVAAYACFTHSRGEVVLAVHVLALLATRRREMSAGLVMAAGGYLAASAVNDALRRSLYPGGARDMAGLLQERLTSVSGQAWSLSGMAGQVWYLVVGTWGLAGIGLVATFAALGRRETRLMAGVLLTTTFGIAYASEAALADEHRVGNFAYGRYLALLALVYVLIAVAVLFRATARNVLRASLAGILIAAGTGATVLLYAGTRLRTHQFIGFDFPETNFLTQDRTQFRLVLATVVATGLLTVLVAAGLLAGRRSGGVWAVALVLLVVNATAMVDIMGDGKRVAPTPPLPAASERGGVVVDRSLHWVARIKLTDPVWWTRIGWIDAAHRAPARGVCTVVVPAATDGTPPTGTWPGHPAGWLTRTGGAGVAAWVAWYDPHCGAATAATGPAAGRPGGH
ncbi:hypothetical protein [Actinomadura harenae]|uniref:Glycosyltransferase RgtA/B/C/D-like domain-containing protein n=1 Tax=Actinomadura harenae TaxID=2483351 RepID=A0A3M2LUV1_9ACTN|nr:hypothetical protein [Actinomadura harenae]RMI39795.1 hypothetical protein EBO15_28740 [Actinomadura harenae]